MTPERWQKVKALCQQALERELSVRSAFLTTSCGTDQDLRRQVEAQLTRATSSDSILDAPVRERLGSSMSPTAAVSGRPAHWMPETIGRYRVLSLVGEGGMGAVYKAEQDLPRRVVALKIIKPGVTGSELLRRFERESQVLARLQHPGIAQIYEAGSAATVHGPQPFFAMEFVHGAPLRDYVERHHLDTRRRLELMARVCDAVEHAHQRGIIHRDLKPGNILVEEGGQPRILDFGVARVTDCDAQATRQTDLGQLVGTLAYMSPEQALADPLELDTRTDVYALGIILYELLANRLPYRLSHKLHEAVRTIREEDPERLSLISRGFRGDVETIVATALEKEKARRYSSAAALAGDIRKYLADEPIAARPATVGYQLHKFARRHKALVGAVGAVFAVLIVGIVGSSWEALRARRAEQKAVAAEQASKAVNDFLETDLLAQASANKQAAPNTKPDPDLKVRTALDRAAARIEGKFDQQPLVEGSIRDTIAATYRDLGLYSEAQTQMERALEIRRRILGERHLDTLNAMATLADLYATEGNFAGAEPLFTRTLELGRSLRRDDQPDTLSIMNDLGVLYWREGKYAAAESILIKVLATRLRVSGQEHNDTLSAMNNLALVYQNEGKYAQAEPLMTKALEIRRRTSGEEHPDTLESQGNMALIYLREGKYLEAETLYANALEIERRVLGENHPDTLTHMNNLGLVYQYEGKYPEARALLTRTLEIRRRVIGAEHPNTLLTMNNLAMTYAAGGGYADAEKLFADTLAIRRRVSGAEHPDTLLAMNHLGQVYMDESKYPEADVLLKGALETSRRVSGEEHPGTLDLRESLAQIYEREGKYAQSEELFVAVLDSRRRVLGNEHTATLRASYYVGHAKFLQRKYETAEAILRDARSVYDQTKTETWQRYRCETLLGVTIARQKRYAEAEPLLLSGNRGLNQRLASIPAGSRHYLEEAQNGLVQLYEDWGKPEQAVEWRQKLRANRLNATRLH